MDTTKNTLSSFIDSNGLFNMIRTPTCFISTQGRCIDLMLINKKYSFKDTQTFETGFSDFHHLIYTILKSRFTKLPPKTIRYRDYSKYSDDQFLTELSFNLAKESPDSIESFTELFDKTLDKHAPFKTVIIRGNNKPHMSKTLRKAIMLRTRLKNRSVKTRNEADFQRCRLQRNLVVKLNKRAKREYFGNLDMNSIKDNKSFWKKLKPLFSNSMVSEKIVLIENEKIIRDDNEISQYFNEYFANITDTPNIPKFPASRYNLLGTLFLMLYKNMPAILAFLRSKRWLRTMDDSNSHLLTPLLFSVRSARWIPLKRQVVLYPPINLNEPQVLAIRRLHIISIMLSVLTCSRIFLSLQMSLQL